MYIQITFNSGDLKSLFSNNNPHRQDARCCAASTSRYSLILMSIHLPSGEAKLQVKPTYVIDNISYMLLTVKAYAFPVLTPLIKNRTLISWHGRGNPWTPFPSLYDDYSGFHFEKTIISKQHAVFVAHPVSVFVAHCSTITIYCSSCSFTILSVFFWKADETTTERWNGKCCNAYHIVISNLQHQNRSLIWCICCFRMYVGVQCWSTPTLSTKLACQGQPYSHQDSLVHIV